MEGKKDIDEKIEAVFHLIIMKQAYVDLSQFATYEDYLDSQITDVDRFYLEVSLFFYID